MKLPTVINYPELEQLVEEIGFLPFFHNDIEGYSLEECTPPGKWFVEGVIGPWEWREEAAEKGRIAYGKLFSKKAGFISMEWYPYFANYRRDGYDFDALYEDGKASRRAKIIMDLFEKEDFLLSSELKRLGGFGKGKEKGFESVLSGLQMQTYLTVDRFQRRRDRFGQEYGWGIGRYTRSETKFGYDLVRSQYKSKPEDSFEIIKEKLHTLFPKATVKQTEQLLK